MILEDRVPTPQQAHGVWASLYRLGGLIGPGGVLASVAFLAYLVGAMLAVRVVTVNAREAPKAARFWGAKTDLTPRVSQLAHDDLVSFLQDHERVPAPEPEVPAAGRTEREDGRRLVVNLAVRDILGETRQLRTKLLIANYDLFNEYDRAVGEAEFRKNVAYALLGLTAALSWMQTPWWAFLLIVDANRIDESEIESTRRGVTVACGRIGVLPHQVSERLSVRGYRTSTKSPVALTAGVVVVPAKL
ncbi:hypothetical protein ACFWP7_15215 [Streptomyces sp. NPDC058470]|uniref:hypothetical protein n=1 Tax=Streptomyces sp. NPDC058470 TaxID=3346515 RepID=UPI00366394EA